MASAQELQYQGNAALAAGTSGNQVIMGTGDFKQAFDAVDRFAAFSMQRNRDKWLDGNVKMQQLAADAAKNLAVTYGNLIPEDREVVDKNVKAMFDFYHNNPTAVRRIVDPNTGVDNAEQHAEFMRLKADLDHSIVRGNLRANQLKIMQDHMGTITDPRRAEEMRSSIMNERKKPISENLVLPPNIKPFNLSEAAVEWSKAGEREFSFIQRFPNDVLTTTKGLFDPFAASQQAITQLYAPGNEDMKDSIGETQALMNTILMRHVREENGRARLDYESLQADPDAKPLLEQINIFNQHVRALNETETVEQGGTTAKRVREFLGYSDDLPLINPDDGLTAQDVIRMSMTYKMGQRTDTKWQGHNQQLTKYNIDVDAQQRAADRRQRESQFWAEFNKGDKEQEAIADEKLNVFYNVMNTPTAGGTYNFDKGGWEITLTAPLVEALKIPSKKTEETTKDKSKDPSFEGQLGGAPVTDEAGTKITTTSIMPKAAYVINKDNKNERSLRVVYEDGTEKYYSSLQFFSSLNGMFGDSEKIKMEVSKASSKRLKSLGMVNPDLYMLEKRFENIPQGSSGGGPKREQIRPGSNRTTEPQTVNTTTTPQTNSSGKRPQPY